MNLRILPILAAVLLLGACAGKPVRAPAPPASASVSPEPPACADPAGCPAAHEAAAATTAQAATQVDGHADATVAATPPVAQAANADGAAPTDAEDDFAALYGGPTADAGAGDGAAPAYDPWEKYNRRMHRFNLAVDRGIARPLATAYVHVVPRVARTGVSNFFGNLRSPLTMVNQLLQGHADDAWDTLGRFLMNSTLGIGGLFDPASKAMVPRRSEDFGQTLGTWGWRQSRYVELPFFGPRTVRDVFGLAGDMPLSPLRRIEMDKLRIGLQGLQLVDTRVQLLSLDDIRDSAVDEYALTRDAWLQRRNYQIEKDLRRDHRRHEDDEQTTIPVDAMPMPDWGR
ncbi:VacJ family lipoprotein [Stenotrophomonas sp. MYb238]|uniref:MlaA family lipoprotein n=1 Tax=Stenotrophomonas sp. MYb238 TaxID=2040281 RepID=UPI001290E7E5|nr:VacJ family lipoprotein [Stenotrophomonas sp. MYb238]MQP75115.1 VacJ family lipoprotein [Stenotrophomonas sp. MYb238]